MQHPPGFLRQVQYTTDAVPAQSFAAKLRVENRGGLCYYPIMQKTAPVRMFGRQKTMPDIYIIGDSTVEDNTPPFRGWGWALKDLTACIEHGYNLGQSYYQRAQVYSAMGDDEHYVEDLEESLNY